MSIAEDAHEPLPGPEEIAALPEDGGPEFNRLVFEQSPYLLQHARNPVDWWPWSDEAFARAERENKPVFLSIGYTTCHWCHVMERESFEDQEVAELINEHFIPVKVDREERPDIDEVYMRITQAITGGGGWPMTVVLTPDKHAFFAGTYFPRESAPGRPNIKVVLTELAKAWNERHEEVVSTAESISEQLADLMDSSPGGDLDTNVFDTAFATFRERFDPERGGFSKRPKFPVPPNLTFLLRYHERTGEPEALEMVEKTLTEMRWGGIYDQVGYGFHRYATDREWLLPHFEKMLYDQALLAIAYLEAHHVTGKERYARAAREILAYVERDMTSPEGAFYSAEDADSEGEEGKFYVWSVGEIRELLDEDDAEFFIERFRLEEEGNFLEEATREKTGANIPHLRQELLDEERARFEGIRETLFAAREERVHPQKDDKILTDWNGLMISAFARAAQVTGRDHYAERATAAAEFVLTELTDDRGRLLKRYRNGEAGLTAHLEDYAFFIAALLHLYETTFEIRWLEEATRLQGLVDELFLDEEDGGYYTIADDAEELIVRAKTLYGGAIPSGNAVAFSNLVRLYRMTGQPEHGRRADEWIRSFSGEISRDPSVYPVVLSALDLHLGPTLEIVISGTEAGSMIEALRDPFLPRKVVLRRTPESADALARIAPFTESQTAIDGRATAYVCRNFACQLPTTDPEVFRESLADADGPVDDDGADKGAFGSSPADQ